MGRVSELRDFGRLIVTWAIPFGFRVTRINFSGDGFSILERVYGSGGGSRGVIVEEKDDTWRFEGVGRVWYGMECIEVRVGHVVW